MRLQVINPNTCIKMTHSIGKSARKVAASTAKITTVPPDHGVPFIKGHYDEAISALRTLQLIQEACKNQINGHIIACFGDPALHAAREIADAPAIDAVTATVKLLEGLHRLRLRTSQ